MYVDLRNVRALTVHVFEFLRSNVLTLSQLEDVLCSVDNLNTSIRHHNTDVA